MSGAWKSPNSHDRCLPVDSVQPHAVTAQPAIEERMPNTPEGRWLSMEAVIQSILADSNNRPSEIAFAISGGGATGAYEAGVIDAWLELVQAKYPAHVDKLRPRFILGSSAGALNATTLLVQLLRPTAGAHFGYEVWRAIAPRSAPYVVGKGRSSFVDVATRWIKQPYAALVSLAATLILLVLLLINPILFGVLLGSLPGANLLSAAIFDHPKIAALIGALISSAAILAFAVLFRRAAFRNESLKNTLANVLEVSCDPKTQTIPAKKLSQKGDEKRASEGIVAAWWAAQRDRRPNYIVTATDLSKGDANLFTLVEPEVFARLAIRGWQVMQLADSASRLATYGGPYESGGWVKSADFVTCVAASTSIPGVFPAQRITLQGIVGNEVVDHDFVDGGVLNNSPIHIALDAGATHIISLELEPLRQQGAFRYIAEGELPSLGRNLVETFETLLAHATAEGIHSASAWNRELLARGGTHAREKRLVPIFRMAPRRRELNLMDFDGHYESAFSRPKPSLVEWLAQGATDARDAALFWEATFQADP
jgi:predicted acylesterase/phospholipase RssA